MDGQNLEEFNLDFYNFFASVAKDLNCTIKSLCNNYVFEVFSVDKNKKFYIIKNSLPINNNVAQNICADKHATSTILTVNGINCVESILLKNPNNFKNWDDSIVKDLLKKFNFVVLKDNLGSSGQLVYKASNFNEFKKNAQIIFSLNKDVVVNPFIDYKDEYRLIMLNNKCEILFKKIKPFVVGDNKSSLQELTIKKYGKDALKTLNISNKNYKPKQNEVIYVGWKNNLKMLAGVEDVNDKQLKKNLETIAKSCTKLLNVDFCSVDIIDDNGVLKVLEINSIVSCLKYLNTSLERQKQVKNMYKKVFLQILNKKD